MDISLENCDTAQDVAQRLRYIAGLVDKGFTSGVNPEWAINAPEDAEVIKETSI